MPAHHPDLTAHVHHGALIRILIVLGALLLAAPARAHQDTVAHSRMVIRANGDVEYALKIPVEDLAETLGRPSHAALNAPEVRDAENLLFQHFQPLISMTSAGAPCPVERRGIDVPEDERLYGELRFVFRCPAEAPVTIDYRVFFDIDPGHVGMLEVESPGGTARAELIRERPRWEVHAPGAGPPQIRAVDGTATLPTEESKPVAGAKAITAEPARSRGEPARAAEPARSRTSSSPRTARAARSATGCSSRSSSSSLQRGRFRRCEWHDAAPHLPRAERRPGHKQLWLATLHSGAPDSRCRRHGVWPTTCRLSSVGWRR